MLELDQNNNKLAPLSVDTYQNSSHFYTTKIYVKQMSELLCDFICLWCIAYFQQFSAEKWQIPYLAEKYHGNLRMQDTIMLEKLEIGQNLRFSPNCGEMYHMSHTE